MNQQRSKNKDGSDGHVRVCSDCGNDMPWIWGGAITYFQCVNCERIEPCANIVIDRKKQTVTIEDGNKNEVFAYSPEDFEKVLKLSLGQ